MGDLQKILRQGGSFVQVDFGARCLVRRVDPTVQEAYAKARESAPEDAAKHLQAAWVHAYGLNPDPDKSYGESVRAVEAALNPMVLPNDNKRTLGKAIGTLKNQSRQGKWELAIGDPANQADNIERLIGMLDLLWTNHDSRHAGTSGSRNQDPKEAEAVLHLAVLLVHWLSSGALTKK